MITLGVRVSALRRDLRLTKKKYLVVNYANMEHTIHPILWYTRIIKFSLEFKYFFKIRVKSPDVEI